MDSICRLVDQDSSFYVQRWNNDIYLEEDILLYSRDWLENSTASPELLAILDAAAWADSESSPRVFSVTKSEEESVIDENFLAVHEQAIDSLVSEEPVAKYSTVSYTNSTPVIPIGESIIHPPPDVHKVAVTKPTMKRSRSADPCMGQQLLPYRTSAEDRALRAFMDSCRGRLSWRRLRQLFLSGFQLTLSHDMDVIVNETLGSTIMFKPESSLSNLDKMDLWLEAMLTGSDQIAIMRKDDTATALRDPQLHFIPTSLLRPDEPSIRKTLYAAYGVLSFLAQNCVEGKTYRFFKSSSNQLVLLEAPPDEIEDQESCRKTDIIERSNLNCIPETIAKECMRLAGHLIQAKYPKPARRLLLHAKEVLERALMGEDAQDLLGLVYQRIWLAAVSRHRLDLHGLAEGEVDEAFTAFVKSLKMLRPVDHEMHLLCEMDFLHLLYNHIGESINNDDATPLRATSNVLITNFLRLQSLTRLVVQYKKWKPTSESSREGFSSLPWLALATTCEVLSIYMRLSNVTETVLATIPNMEAAISELRLNCNSWSAIKSCWHVQPKIFRKCEELFANEVSTSLAVACFLFHENAREKVIHAVWKQWASSGMHFTTSKDPKEAVSALFVRADEICASSQLTNCNECFGSSLLLMARAYNDSAVSNLFSYDVKNRRLNLPKSTAELIMAFHLLKLNFFILVTRLEEDPQDLAALKCVVEWISVVTINLVRAVQLNSNMFRVTASDNLKGALSEGRIESQDVNSCFSFGQLNAYLSAIEMSKRLSAFANEASSYYSANPLPSNRQSSPTSPNLPLQTGLSCDQLLPHRLSVQPFYHFDLPQLAVICEERQPYMSMALAVDMMQYSPAQQLLVHDEKWKKYRAPVKTGNKILLSMPRVEALVSTGKVNPRYPKQLIESFIHLCDSNIQAMVPDITHTLCPLKQGEVLSEFLEPSFAYTTFSEEREADYAEWLKDLAHRYPKKSNDLPSLKRAQLPKQHSTLSIVRRFTKNSAYSKLVSQIDTSKIPRDELQRWLSKAIMDLDPSSEDLGDVLALERPVMPLTDPAKFAPLQSKLFSLAHLLNANTGDLPSIVEHHLQYAAANFKVDERESAAAHYHLGVYLNSLINRKSAEAACESSQKATLHKRLNEKRRAMAVQHLNAARQAFSPTYCLKDYVNVQSVLFNIKREEDVYEAVALTLAADLYATESKNAQPKENPFEDERFIKRDQEYIGVITLRSLAMSGLMDILKRTAPLTAAVAEATTIQDRIKNRLLAMSSAEIKTLYKSLLKQQPYIHFFPLQ